LGDEKIRRRLRRLDKRLLTVASQLQRIQTEQKWGKIGQLITVGQSAATIFASTQVQQIKSFPFKKQTAGE